MKCFVLIVLKNTLEWQHKIWIRDLTDVNRQKMLMNLHINTEKIKNNNYNKTKTLTKDHIYLSIKNKWKHQDSVNDKRDVRNLYLKKNNNWRFSGGLNMILPYFLSSLQIFWNVLFSVYVYLLHQFYKIFT